MKTPANAANIRSQVPGQMAMPGQVSGMNMPGQMPSRLGNPVTQRQMNPGMVRFNFIILLNLSFYVFIIVLVYDGRIRTVLLFLVEFCQPNQPVCV